jgi:dihydropyrimidinase
VDGAGAGRHAMSFDSVITGGTVIDPVRGDLDVSIGIKDGKIAALLEPGLSPSAEEQIDAKGLVVMPGAIDPHMHIGFVGMPLDDVETETRSGASGGVT